MTITFRPILTQSKIKQLCAELLPYNCLKLPYFTTPTNVLKQYSSTYDHKILSRFDIYRFMIRGVIALFHAYTTLTLP